MQRSRKDPCLLISRETSGLKGVIILQVDDSLILGTRILIDDEARASLEFRSKPRKFLKEGKKELNGSMVSQYKDRSVVINQKANILKLEIPTNEKSFTSHRVL